MTDILISNLLSPAVLFFVMGVFAAIVKSDLKFPPALSETLSIYLLIAIGFKGGMYLSKYEIGELILPMTGALFIGTVIPVITIFICRRLGMSISNAAAVGATYGSVSIVTYGAAVAFLDYSNMPFESYMGALVVLLESPAILVSLLIYKRMELSASVQPGRSPYAMGITATGGFQWSQFKTFLPILKESLFGKSILLMAGALFVGLISGDTAMPVIKPVFIDLYPGILVVFLLGMGLTAGERLADLKKEGLMVPVLAVSMPLVFGLFGALVGAACGLSTGGTAMMGVLAASASYIAAPAAVKHSIPDANPSIYLGMALGITFPFNLIVGIPLYVQFAHWFT